MDFSTIRTKAEQLRVVLSHCFVVRYSFVLLDLNSSVGNENRVCYYDWNFPYDPPLSYESLAALKSDCELMCKNCLKYNTEDTPFHGLALKMLREVERIITVKRSWVQIEFSKFFIYYHFLTDSICPNICLVITKTGFSWWLYLVCIEPNHTLILW